MTLTLTVHDAFAASVPPARPMLAPPAAPPVTLPPQPLTTFGDAAFTSPDGYGSSNASAPIGLAFGFVIVIVSVVAKFTLTGFGLNPLAMPGATIVLLTVNVAFAAEPAPAFAVVAGPLLLA